MLLHGSTFSAHQLKCTVVKFDPSENHPGTRFKVCMSVISLSFLLLMETGMGYNLCNIGQTGRDSTLDDRHPFLL